jgi:hypothetical protein
MGDKDAIFYDYHEEFAESKFDRALFDQLVHTCVTYVPRGKVTTYGETRWRKRWNKFQAPHSPFNDPLVHTLLITMKDTSHVCVIAPNMHGTSVRPCDDCP